MDQEETTSALVTGWQNAVDKFLYDGVISQEAEDRLVKFQRTLNLPQSKLDSNGAFTRVVKAAILRDLMNGQLPNRVKIEGSHPFNLQKSETVIWLFNGVQYYEERTRREYRGASSGMSIRIAKGVYYRFGSFRGYPVDTQQTVHVDTGLLGITNKHVYFAGPHKSFRIKVDKIVSISPHDDGVGISKDSANAKPQFFVTGDGWFTYNLLHNLNHLPE